MKRNERVIITAGRLKGKEGYYINECSEPELEGRYYVRLFGKNTKVALYPQEFEKIKE